MNLGDKKRQIISIFPQTKKYKENKYKEGPAEAIIPLIVSTHGNYIVDSESQLPIIDFRDLLPPGSSDKYTIWTLTFMPVLGNPATHIKETMDLMYLSRDFFLQLFSLNLEDEYFTRYIQEAQYIVSRNYMSIMIPQICASLKQTYDALLFNIYKELFYDATRPKSTIEITPAELLQIAGDIRNNSEKLKDFLNNLLGFQEPAVVKNLMWLVKTDKDNRQFVPKVFTTDSSLLAQKQEKQYEGSGQDPWDIIMTYQGVNTVLFGNITNGQQNKKGKKSAETYYNISNQDLIKQVFSNHRDEKTVLIVDASCAHLQKKNKNAVVDRFIIAKEQELIERLFPNKITMTEDNAIKIANLVKVMLAELNFQSLLEDCYNILQSISQLGEVMPLIKAQMIKKIGNQLTKPNMDSMTFFNENSILVTKTLKEILRPKTPLRRAKSVVVSSVSEVYEPVNEPVKKGKSLTMPTSNRGLLSSIAGVDVISDAGVRMTKIKLDEILERAATGAASGAASATGAATGAASATTGAAATADMDDDLGGGSRRKNASKKSMKRNRKTRSRQSIRRKRRRKRITRKRVKGTQFL